MRVPETVTGRGHRVGVAVPGEMQVIYVFLFFKLYLQFGSCCESDPELPHPVRVAMMIVAMHGSNARRILRVRGSGVRRVPVCMRNRLGGCCWL